MMFAVRVIDYNGNSMLNMCDSELLGTTINDGRMAMKITRTYYGNREVDETEARGLLRDSTIINMVGERTVSMAVSMGIGTQNGVRTISGVPFLIVFRM